MHATLLRALLFSPAAPVPAASARDVIAELRPLVGGPPFLPLHVVVQHGGREYDFLPQRPTAPQTLAALATGGAVEGRVRCRAVLVRGASARWRVTLGKSSVAPDALEQFARGHPRALRLLQNDCWTFAHAVSQHALTEQGDGASDMLRDE
jgi:hypothetical protein